MDMGHRERIRDYVAKLPGRDDDEIAYALGISPRQTVNRICRTLAESGDLERSRRADGKLGNYPLPTTAPSTDRSSTKKPQAPPSGVPTDWYWEGHIVSALVEWLMADEWIIIRCADTASRERGPDIHAERSGETLLVEVKGYPSKEYRDANRAGEKKRTSPSLQAQHWFSQAVLKGMRLQNEFPDATVALGFPEFPRYESLAGEIGGGLAKVGLKIIFVNEAGAISPQRHDEKLP